MLAMWLFFWPPNWPIGPSGGGQVPPGSKYKWEGRLPFIFR